MACGRLMSEGLFRERACVLGMPPLNGPLASKENTMANGSNKDISKGTTNQPKNTGEGSPRLQGTWSRKHNTGGKDKVNSKRISVK